MESDRPGWTYQVDGLNKRDVAVFVVRERLGRLRSAIIDVVPIYKLILPNSTVSHVGGNPGEMGAMYNIVTWPQNGNGRPSTSQAYLQFNDENDIEYVLKSLQTTFNFPDSSFRFTLEEVNSEFTKVTLISTGMVSSAGFVVPPPCCCLTPLAQNAVRTQLTQSYQQLYQGLCNLPTSPENISHVGGIQTAVPMAEVMTRSNPQNDHIGALERLVRLRDAGALTPAEFDAEKAKIIGHSNEPVPVEILKLT